MFSTRRTNGKRASACGALAFVLGVAEAQAQDAACAAPSGETVRIVSIDIHLEPRLADGRKLRLRGIEPPRGTPSNPQLAEQTRSALAARIEGRSLTMSAGAGGRDRWGRIPAFLAAPDGSTHATLSGEAIAIGLVRADPADSPRECRGEFLRLEAQARAARLGLWSDEAYAAIDAARAENFAGQGGQIVLAEAAVVSTGQWRTLTFLNFGRGRGGASVAISRSVLRELEQAGVQPAALKGKRIRVRGQLSLRSSPRIELFSAAALEVLGAQPVYGRAQRNENGN